MSDRGERYYPIMSEEEYLKLLNTIWAHEAHKKNNAGMFMKWRDVTALKLMFYCGLRPGEALNLRWKDVDFNKMSIQVQMYFNKTKSELPAPLTLPAKEALMEYANALDNIGVKFEFLFPSLETFEPVSTDRFSRLFTSYAKDAGILKLKWTTDGGQPKYNYSLYSGRRWFGTQTWRKTKSDVAVQFLMRHKNRASSEPYVRLDDEDRYALAKGLFKDGNNIDIRIQGENKPDMTILSDAEKEARRGGKDDTTN